MATQTVRDVLSRYSQYYRRLNLTNQQRFESRLAELLLHVTFTAENSNEDIPLEMKIVIGSAQIQLTFGLDQFLPVNYEQITVMRDAYRVTNYEKPLIGHVDPNQTAIYLSWKHVRHGFLIPDDAVNVALHEFAHWLDMENKVLDFELMCEAEYSQWRKHAMEKLLTVRERKNKFLKDYSGRNMLEMFAVSVEAFFEQSQQFQQKIPGLYDALADLLNQNPINETDPVVEG